MAERPYAGSAVQMDRPTLVQVQLYSCDTLAYGLYKRSQTTG